MKITGGSEEFAAQLVRVLASHGRALQIPARRSWASADHVDRHSLIVCSGLLALYREGPTGERRLVALRYPGEIVAPHEKGLACAAVVPTEIFAVSGSIFIEAINRDVALSRGFERGLKRAQLIAYEWLSRDAVETTSRVAHFLCEHAVRQGTETEEVLSLELSQNVLGEITAQTPVNVNRVIGGFLKKGILSQVGRRTYTVKWPELRRLGRFNPAYLY